MALPLTTWPFGEPIPVLTAVPLEGVKRPFDVEHAVREFVKEAAAVAWSRSEGQPSFEGKRPQPLLAMPSFATDGGGGSELRGAILESLLDTARIAAAESRVDIVLVLRDERTFALAQEKRKQRHHDYWPSLDDSVMQNVRRLAALASGGKLVPFMGAGVSVSAGAPSWGRLIEVLAAGVDLPSSVRESLRNKDRDALDQAAFLRAIYMDQRPDGSSSGDGGFAAGIIKAVALERYGLAPALLASLKTEQAITLNYDELFERASADAGMARSVIPGALKPDADAWLLKLHGSVTDSTSIVLTRDDYLGFNATREALSAIVKATLITHHLLFVGFGLADDHFHQIIHDVRRALPGDGNEAMELATALTLRSDPLNSTLWKGRLDILPMGDSGTSVADAARALEIFLDALLAFATDSHSYLLAGGYEAALSESEHKLRASLLALSSSIDASQRESPSWRHVADMFRKLGLGG